MICILELPIFGYLRRLYHTQPPPPPSFSKEMASPAKTAAEDSVSVATTQAVLRPSSSTPLNVPPLAMVPSSGVPISSTATEAVVTTTVPLGSITEPTSSEVPVGLAVAISKKRKRPEEGDAAEAIKPVPTIESHVRIGGEGSGNESALHTWEGMWSASQSTSLSRNDLLALAIHFKIMKPIATKLPSRGEHVSCPRFKDFYGVNVEMLRYGVRFPVHPFINFFLKRINRAPGQLLPKAWVALIGFLYGCHRSGLCPSEDLFSHLYRIEHLGWFTSIVSRDQLVFTKMPSSNNERRMLGRWFFIRGAFSSSVPQFWTSYSHAAHLYPVDTNAYREDVGQFKRILKNKVRLEWLVSEEGLHVAGLRPPYEVVSNADWGRYPFFPLPFLPVFTLI